MNVLLIGGGGREHALAWKIAQSPRLKKLYIAPGNGGTRLIGENVRVGVMEFEKLTAFAREKEIDLSICTMDDPLAGGIVDFFRSKKLRIWGPTKAAAQIESSKAFAKEIMASARVPTADFRTFTDYEAALGYVHVRGVPIVIKASGLALGKGAYVCKTMAEAEQALKDIFIDRIFKDAGNEVVIEEFLKGQEISIHALTDGRNIAMFPPSQDHKTIGEGDTGKNTGGIGTICPIPWVADDQMSTIQHSIVEPTIAKLRERGIEFSGLLYPGLMMTVDGPKVLEFNARFGDPEPQVYMRLLKTDLLDLLDGCIDGTLDPQKVEWNPGYAANVVLCSAGYPDSYKKGLEITGIEKAEQIPGVVVFHAGTQYEGSLKTAGGRVLGVSAVGGSLKTAIERAYEAVDLIQFEGKYFRRDIGAKALALQ